MNSEDRLIAGIAVLVLIFLGALLGLSMRSENLKIDGCKDAGGSMVGEICIIRRDCATPVD